MNPTWRKTLVEQISDEAHSIRNDLATTHTMRLPWRLVFSSFAVFPVATSRIILATSARSTALTRKLPIRGTT
jgi:hypothetical protein